LPPGTIPFVILNITAKDDSYFLQIHGDGVRKFILKPEYEKSIYDRLRDTLWDKFNRLLTDRDFVEPLPSETENPEEEMNINGILMSGTDDY